MTTPRETLPAPGQPEPDHEQQLSELLEICADYFDKADPPARAELDALLREHGITGGPGWMIDMLSFTHLRLQQRTGHPT